MDSNVLLRYQNNVLQAFDSNDIVIFPGIGGPKLFSFIQRIQDIRYCFVSDDFQLNEFLPTLVPKRHIYGDYNERDSSWFTYDVALYLLAKGKLDYDFLILDSIDDRTVKSDLFLALLQLMRPRGKLAISLRSHFLVNLDADYLRSFKMYSVQVLDLIKRPQVDTYYLASTTQDLNKETISTIKSILEQDSLTNAYDILVLLPIPSQIHEFSHYLQDSFSQRNFSILTDAAKYEYDGSHRRIIISTDSKRFLLVKHRIKYIIDHGLIVQEKIDTNGLKSVEVISKDKRRMFADISILQIEGSKYFGLFDQNIPEFKHGMKYDELYVMLLYLINLDVDISTFSLLGEVDLDNCHLCINYLMYMGLITIKAGQLKLTTIGKHLLQVQFEFNIKSLSLFTALVTCDNKATLNETLKITAMLLEAPDLSSQLQNPQMFHKSLIHETSDILSSLRIFNALRENQSLKSPYNNKSFRLKVNRTYYSLKKTFQISSTDVKIDEGEILNAFMKGFLINCGTIEKSIDNKGKERMLIHPLRPFEDTSLQIQIKIPNMDHFSTGDFVIFADCTMLLQNDGTIALGYANLVSKMDKGVALEASQLIRSATRI